MEIKITNTNSLRFKVWIDGWDIDFETFIDARSFLSYIKYNYAYRTCKIEVILVETLSWDGENGKYKNHILATIKDELDEMYKKAEEDHWEFD